MQWNDTVALSTHYIKGTAYPFPCTVCIYVHTVWYYTPQHVHVNATVYTLCWFWKRNSFLSYAHVQSKSTHAYLYINICIICMHITCYMHACAHVHVHDYYGGYTVIECSDSHTISQCMILFPFSLNWPIMQPLYSCLCLSLLPSFLICIPFLPFLLLSIPSHVL